MVSGIGKGIGELMVFLACAAALGVPLGLASVVGIPLLLLGYQSAALVAWGVGGLVSIASFVFVLRESR